MVGSAVDGHPPQMPGNTTTSAEDVQRVTQTIAFLEARIEANPADDMSHHKLAALRLERGRSSGDHDELVRAEDAFRSALALMDSTAARAGLAYSLLGQHRFREALTEARRAAHRAPHDPSIRALLGDVHFALGNYSEAEAFYRNLVEEELGFETLVRWAMMLQHRGQHSEADVVYHEALDAAEMLGVSAAARAWCHTIIGEFDLFIHGDPDAAAAHLEAALALDPDAHAAAWRMATIDQLRGDHAQARARLIAVVERHPKPAYMTALAHACTGLGTKDAEEEAEVWRRRARAAMASEIERGEVGHAREMVELLLVEGDDPSQAVSLALRDLENVRADVGAYEVAAWALHHAGRNDKAIPLMRQALTLSSADPRTVWRAGVILEAAGRTAEGQAFLSRARTQNAHIDALCGE